MSLHKLYHGSDYKGTSIFLLTITLLSTAAQTSATTACDNTVYSPGTVDEALGLVNAARRRVYQGLQKNGESGEYLPAAASEPTQVEWDCSLEAEAYKMLQDGCPTLCSDEDKTLYVEGSLARINYTALTNIYGDPRYSGESSLARFSQFMWTETKKVGCSQCTCEVVDGMLLNVTTYSTCIFDSGDIKDGDVIYHAKSACNSKQYMNDAIRIAFLAKHNSLRSVLALGGAPNGNTGNYTRPATNMSTLVYDCDLEEAAYERAKLCESYTPESPDTLKENSFNYTHRARTFEQAAKLSTQSWWAELKNSEGLEQIQNIFYTHLGLNRFAKIGSDLTTKVGCGIYNCTSIVNIVCRYETTLANAKKLYAAGPNCNKCKATCANGLCPAVATGDL